VTLPRRDPHGGSLAESGTLTFITELLRAEGPRQAPVLELSTSEGVRKAVGIAIAESEPARPPRAVIPASGELRLGRDLLEVRHLESGKQRYLSPSSLERLIVSPLAWLLERVGLDVRLWAPEEVGPAERGTIAHDVFEHLFAAGPLPEADVVAPRARSFLVDAVRRNAPFMLAGTWRVERLNLASEIQQAAETWHRILTRLGGQIVASERFLFGELDGARLVGRVDAVVAMPDGVRYVVDYKKSSSRSRRERMEKGYDHQASLYRLLLEERRRRPPRRSDEERDADARLDKALADATETGVMYFNMNDGVVLADTAAGGLAGVSEARVVPDDVARGAMQLIAERLGEVRAGVIRLNREGDKERFEKLRIGTYVLDDHALVGLLTMLDEGDEEAAS